MVFMFAHNVNIQLINEILLIFKALVLKNLIDFLANTFSVPGCSYFSVTGPPPAWSAWQRKVFAYADLAYAAEGYF